MSHGIAGFVKDMPERNRDWLQQGKYPIALSRGQGI